MTFSTLSLYFQKLESTPSRNSMTEILAELFTKAGKDEIGKLCYLLQGRVAPLYEPIEFGVGEKFMIRAIAKACGVEEVQVQKEFKKVGDLGIVTEKIKNQKSKIKNTDQTLTIETIYKKLVDITGMGGEGSQDQKIEALADVLSSLDALSARYFVRITLDKIRLGFSDMTILDGLSWMLTGDKSQRDRLEEVYNIRPDIGLLATEIKAAGIAGLSHVKAKVGAPILASLCQRLPSADEMIKKMGEVAVEPKYDGVRCVSGSTGVLTLNRGYISACNIRIGDSVLTHKGRFRAITAVARRSPQKGERFYRIQTMMGDHITVSEFHKLFVYRDGETQWMEAKEVSLTDWQVFPITHHNTSSFTSRLELEDPAGYKKYIPYSEAFFRFLGFWVGDGFTNNSHQSERIGLTFNAKTEKTLADEYEQIIRGTLGIREISISERGGGLNLYWRDPTLRRWITREFRYSEKNGDHGKYIPLWMFTIRRNQFLAFIRGWQEADGTERHGGGNRITTKERRLACLAVVLGSSFGYLIGVRRTRAKATPNGPTKTYYELIMPGSDRYYRRDKNEFIVKVHSIDRVKLHPKTHLYDFQVEDDESFCSSLVTLHNCQIHVEKSKVESQESKVNTYSRNLENTTEMFPELQNVGGQLNAHDVILDSEAVGMDPKTGKLIPFQETSTRKRKHEIQASLLRVPLKFFVFDILYKDGKDLLATPLSERRKILEATIKTTQDSRNQKFPDSGNLRTGNRGDMLVVSPQIVTDSPAVIRAYHDEQIKKGLEGAVVKKWGSPYEPGRRGYNWVKFKEEEGATGKLTDTIDAVVMGYYRGEGKRAGFGIGAFLVGVKKGEAFVTITKIGTGVTDTMWKELERDFRRMTSDVRPKQYGEVPKMLEPDVWINPKIVVEIAGDDLTKSSTHGAGVAVRFPRLVRIRTDKSPAQATTVGEIVKMYREQGGKTRGR